MVNRLFDRILGTAGRMMPPTPFENAILRRFLRFSNLLSLQKDMLVNCFSIMPLGFRKLLQRPLVISMSWVQQMLGLTCFYLSTERPPSVTFKGTKMNILERGLGRRGRAIRKCLTRGLAFRRLQGSLGHTDRVTIDFPKSATHKLHFTEPSSRQPRLGPEKWKLLWYVRKSLLLTDVTS